MGMHLGIDASNIRQGGGVTHLSQFLAAASPSLVDINRITVWAPRGTAAALPRRDWLVVQSPSWVDAVLPVRAGAQHFLINKELKREGCDALLSPGGTVPFRCSVPVVVMSQNMLPFEPDETILFWAL